MTFGAQFELVKGLIQAAGGMGTGEAGTVSGLTVEMFDRTSVVGATTGLTVLVFLAIGCKKRPQELNSWQLLTLASLHCNLLFQLSQSFSGLGPL